ncbi:alpha/beta fold hydrolase [Mycobacteroides abscessus]|uniref:alpha/beta fold hydrolase n=1 Tax=Mycobacteroides abscessus TaxID=36809 RepID=UPI001877812E|nr:hypothetical protein [Mycobacteroides abscessus]MDM2082833.1 alpha/beta fold hydrolase [Mycobacteroides abscessus]MDM2086007.1 alpha/beta fold hydrolase [Mycobacteroides abscessus]
MVKIVDFDAFDGVRLRGIYTQARGSVRGSFLLTHGLPSDKDEYGFYSDMANFLAANGYSSLRFDFRGCGDSDEFDFRKITISHLINDIDSAYRALVELAEPSTPPALVSTSASGGAGLLWAGITGNAVERVFLMAPVLRYWQEAVGRQPRGDILPDLTADEIGYLRESGSLGHGEAYGSGFLHEARLVDLLRDKLRFRGQVTIMHGDSDTVVPIDGSREMSALNDNVELIEVAGADHGFSVEDDDDLTDPETKRNHDFVYRNMLERVVS